MLRKNLSGASRRRYSHREVARGSSGIVTIFFLGILIFLLDSLPSAIKEYVEAFLLLFDPEELMQQVSEAIREIEELTN